MSLTPSDWHADLQKNQGKPIPDCIRACGGSIIPTDPLHCTNGCNIEFAFRTWATYEASRLARMAPAPVSASLVSPASPVASNGLTRTSPDGQTVVTIARQGKRTTPALSVRECGVLTVSEDFAISKRNARAELVARYPEPIREWLAAALLELSEAWSTTRPDATADVPEPKSRLTQDTDPWHESVDLARVLSAIETHIARHLVMPEHGHLALALWIALTHWIDALRRTPYLWIESPVRECAKSTILDVCAQLVARGWKLSNPSGAALFRTIEAERPTILLDEIDTITGQKLEDLTGLLNDGYQRDGRVARCVGEDNEVKTFSVFCAKAFAGIGTTLADATRSRCIRITMSRATAEELRGIAKFREDHAARWAVPLRRQLARAAVDTIAQLQETLQDPDATEIPDGIHGRDADVWEPLLALADLAGGAWPARARSACVAFVKVRRSDDDGDTKVRLLRDLQSYFTERHVDAATSAILIEWLIEDESRGWSEYRGRPLSPHALARLLKPFKVAPVKRRDGASTARVWLRTDLDPVWQKYLANAPSEMSATTATSAAPITAPTVGVPDVPLVALVPIPLTGESPDDSYWGSLLADEAIVAAEEVCE